MKISGKILIFYCVIFGGSASLNLIADPSDQPIKHGIIVAIMLATILGVWFKKKYLLMPMPFYFLYYTFTTWSLNNNIYAIVGQAVGSLIPISLIYLNYININVSKGLRSHEN
ncbi:MAG: hypothetical protein ACXVCP_08380 [Bdellovibrio sp.]